VAEIVGKHYNKSPKVSKEKQKVAKGVERAEKGKRKVVKKTQKVAKGKRKVK
jgi:hypothetical protein